MFKQWINGGKKYPALGIDINTTSLKTVELTREKQRIHLRSFAHDPVPEGVIVEGCLSDKETVSTTLAKQVQQFGWQNRQAVTAVRAKKALIRHLKVPAMPASELRQAVHWEAEKYLPLEQNDYVLDFMNLGRVGPRTERRVLILLAAIPRDIAMTYYEVFARASLELVALEIIPLALQRAINAGQHEDYAIVHIDHDSTHLVVISANRISFTRTIALTAANSFKRSNDLGRELKRSLDFWQPQAQGKNIEHLYITGDLAGMPAADKLLSQELNLPAAIATPSINSQAGKDFGPEFAIACGLALRGARGK